MILSVVSVMSWQAFLCFGQCFTWHSLKTYISKIMTQTFSTFETKICILHPILKKHTSLYSICFSNVFKFVSQCPGKAYVNFIKTLGAMCESGKVLSRSHMWPFDILKREAAHFFSLTCGNLQELFPFRHLCSTGSTLCGLCEHAGGSTHDTHSLPVLYGLVFIWRFSTLPDNSKYFIQLATLTHSHKHFFF